MRNLLITIIVLLLNCYFSFSQTEKASCDIIVYNGYSFVEAKFENYNKPVLFLFDTGTDYFAINYKLVEELNLKKEDTLEFTLGSIPIKSTFSMPHSKKSQSDSSMRAYMGSLLDGKIYGGILGNPAFYEFYLIIDYPNLELKAYEQLNSNTENLEFDVTYSDFIYNTKQIFIEAKINDKVTGYMHLDTGIPDLNILEFIYAKEAELSDLRALPNTTDSIKYEIIYDDEGVPISRTEQVIGVFNHREPSYSTSFLVGNMNFGKQSFTTMDTDLDQQVFLDADLRPIIGSIGYGTMKDYQIHLDFKNTKIAFQRY